MKKMGKIMAEMGFRKDAPLDTKKAFFKSLLNMAQQQEDQRQSQRLAEVKSFSPKNSSKEVRPIQLSLFPLVDEEQKKSS